MATVEKSLRSDTFKLWVPNEYDAREFAMIKEICESLIDEVIDLTNISFRLFMEECELTGKHVAWQAKLTSMPEIVQIPGSAPIMTTCAQVQYDAVNHSDSTENYHGCFNMAIQTIAVPGDCATLLAGKEWMTDRRAYSVLRLTESLYRSSIKNHYHEWGTHYEDGLLFADKPVLFMHELGTFPELQEKTK